MCTGSIDEEVLSKCMLTDVSVSIAAGGAAGGGSVCEMQAVLTEMQPLPEGTWWSRSPSREIPGVSEMQLGVHLCFWGVPAGRREAERDGPCAGSRCAL